MNLRFAATLLISLSLHAQDDFPLTEESKPQPNVPKGQMLKGTYTAKDSSVFPGTEREYQIYLPANLDTSKPAPFMVFQDGVIYNAPTVFDNLIAKKDLPPMIGIFIKPGVVPAANENALPRYNRSYEYDSVTDTYSRFLINEFLPAIVAKHQLNLSADPNARGISGNSSGGICAFMVAWHRPDQFRRVFTGVGTYVGIHGADQLAVLVRKHEPKPLRVFLQSGENDNNLYCGDWWMANQMMERSLTWNGYDVNHAWGKGGHNAKHASQIFPDVLRWLWKGYPNEPVKANPRGDAKWRGYEVVGAGEWERVSIDFKGDGFPEPQMEQITASVDGSLFVSGRYCHGIVKLDTSGNRQTIKLPVSNVTALTIGAEGRIYVGDHSRFETRKSWFAVLEADGKLHSHSDKVDIYSLVTHAKLGAFGCDAWHLYRLASETPIVWQNLVEKTDDNEGDDWMVQQIVIGPDQTILYAVGAPVHDIVRAYRVNDSGNLSAGQDFGCLERTGFSDDSGMRQMCVDTNGWLYVATSLGIQVLDQAGRVNFIIPTPKQPHDVCFGGMGLSELFVACGDTIYKRPTKAKGYISGQMAPIKPPAPKL